MLRSERSMWATHKTQTNELAFRIYSVACASLQEPHTADSPILKLL